MSDRTFSRRRKGGMRFKPSKSPRDKTYRAGSKTRPLQGPAKSADEPIFAKNRHESEIRQAENRAVGLPPDAVDEKPSGGGQGGQGGGQRSVRSTRAKKAAVESESSPAQTAPENGLTASLRAAAGKVIKRVQHFIRPKPRNEHEIIINAESLETRVAILEGGKLEEFNIERTESERLVGSIFKGIVRNLEDGLKAAFVDIGFDKNSFLHYWDIVPSNFDSGIEVVERSSRKKRDKRKITHKDIPKLYPPNSEIIVQVTKGPIGTKGPRVTTNLSLPGRYLVLLPTSDQSGISRKIESQQERQRLKTILRKLTIPDGMGVVMRTAGEGKKARFFVRDLALLLEEWNQIQASIQAQKAPACVFQEPDLIGRTVRDFLTEEVQRIVVDDNKSYEKIRGMVERISQRSISKVKLYSDSQAIFDRFNITRQIENAFARQVHLRSGGYIVFDETEALVAIDVNTGRHKATKDETTILEVNLEAAEEICRQLRLRNIGGLIILDFIDMKSRREQMMVYQRVKELLKRDKAKTHALPISQLGLMEMTRQRHTESVHSAVYVDCPMCKGRGVVKSALTMSVEIQRKLSEILKRRPRDESDYQLLIAVHPTVLDRLRTEDEELLIDLEKKYFGKLSFRADNDLHPEQFRIVDVSNNSELVSV